MLQVCCNSVYVIHEAAKTRLFVYMYAEKHMETHERFYTGKHTDINYLERKTDCRSPHQDITSPCEMLIYSKRNEHLVLLTHTHTIIIIIIIIDTALQYTK